MFLERKVKQDLNIDNLAHYLNITGGLESGNIKILGSSLSNMIERTSPETDSGRDILRLSLRACLIVSIITLTSQLTPSLCL